MVVQQGRGKGRVLVYFRSKVIWGHLKMTSPVQGGEGYPKLLTKSDIGGGGYVQIVTSPAQKNMYKFLFFACFWSAQQLRLNSSTEIWYSNLVVSTQINIIQEVRNRFYRSLNMLLVHQLIYLIRTSIVTYQPCKI